jgi:AraC family transcriptional regulator of arabinose operon
VFFGDVVYEPGGTCGPRMQMDYQLVVLVEGEANVTVDGAGRRVAAGEAGLFRPGHREFFRLSETRKTRHTWCALHPSLVGRELAAACAHAPDVRPVSRRFEQLMELGLALPRRAGERAPGLVEALGLAALHEYLFAGGRADGGGPDEPDALRRALEWVGQAGHEAMDLPGLARTAGVSPAQLVKLFKRHLGVTPLRYVWEARTRRGAQLLRETGLTVAEVAYRCGFQTPFHFSRWIKACEGVSPRELRARAWARR